jgi:hypothetical protein
MSSFDLSVSFTHENECIGLKYGEKIKMWHVNNSDLHLMVLG